MPSARQFVPGASCPPGTPADGACGVPTSFYAPDPDPKTASPLTRLGACGVLALAASLLLVGCDAGQKALNTAPSEVDVVTDGGELAEDPDSPSANTDQVRGTVLGAPLAGLSAAELARFEHGKEDFQEIETPEDGLGPVFTEASCVTCHNNPIGGTTGRAETRFGRVGRRGGFDPLAELGGSLLQDHAIGKVGSGNTEYTFVAEEIPRSANVIAKRITTPLFGLGLVDAVPDAAFIELARQQARKTPSTRGIPHMVTEIATGATRVGRFGWKAQVPTLHQFAGDAYLNEMGITNPDFPEESYPQGNRELMKYNPFPDMNDDGEGVELFTDFMTFMGPPPRGFRTSVTEAGSKVFRNIGCANCHTPTLVTGNSPVPAIAHKAFQPYSDFLLHDMGSLGDGIVQGQATGRLMRTAPLWGLTSRPTLLHDGRAKTPQAAILAHAGQAADARNRFLRLDGRDRWMLLAFLKSI